MQTSLQTNPVPATVSGFPLPYAAILYRRERDHIDSTVHVAVSHDPAARSQEIYAEMHKIHELEEGDPAVIQAYCSDVINADASIKLILAAMAAPKANIGAHDYPAHNRILIRDALKDVFFHAHLDNAATTQLYEEIHAISRMK